MFRKRLEDYLEDPELLQEWAEEANTSVDNFSGIIKKALERKQDDDEIKSLQEKDNKIYDSMPWKYREFAMLHKVLSVEEENWKKLVREWINANLRWNQVIWYELFKKGIRILTLHKIWEVLQGEFQNTSSEYHHEHVSGWRYRKILRWPTFYERVQSSLEFAVEEKLWTLTNDPDFQEMIKKWWGIKQELLDFLLPKKRPFFDVDWPSEVYDTALWLWWWTVFNRAGWDGARKKGLAV